MIPSQETVTDVELARIVYLSRIHLQPQQRETEIVADIVMVSLQRNRASGITGCLLALNGWFIQSIEGPVAPLETTFARIAGDSRHGFLKVIENRRVTERLFPDWAMCARALPPTDVAICAVVGRHFTIVPDRFDAATAIALLQAVRKVKDLQTLWLW
jgi:hypothetical protein